ncbi:MAG: peptide chain release factor 1 [Phototrophicaceae bacterium]
MLDKLAGIAARYDEIERLMGDPEIASDYVRVGELNKERSDLQTLVDSYNYYLQQQAELEDAQELLHDSADDEEMREMAELEVTELQAAQEALFEKLKFMLLPKDPRDGKNAIIEIRAGAGGDEAGLFAGDLYRMYSRFADKQKWKVEMLEENISGGEVVKSVTFMVKGNNVFSRLKFESGVHRVQRVPTTESQGRIHTSTSTVAVLAEMDEVDVHFNMSDVRVDVFRSQGAGGQSVNTTDSAVRMTHIPTGIVVEMQDERSQLQNRLRAQKILVARIYEAEVERQRNEQDAERRGQIGSGDRSEKIRTYNFPQNRVTDHRVNFSSYNLPAVMDGDLDEFVDELTIAQQAELLSRTGE